MKLHTALLALFFTTGIKEERSDTPLHLVCAFSIMSSVFPPYDKCLFLMSSTHTHMDCCYTML